MAEPQRLITRSLADHDRQALQEFCDTAAAAGLVNNASLEAMRFEWCRAQGGAWFGSWLGDQLVSISGCHPMPQIGPMAYRVLFRGCTLPGYANLERAVSKTHMNSVPFREHLPLAADHALGQGYPNIMITTNWRNPGGMLSMDSSHRVLNYLARQGLVSLLVERLRLFGTDQAVWSVNMPRYQAARSDFMGRHGL